MRAYELKRGWAKNLAGGGLKALAAAAFGSATEEGGKVVASFGAISRLTAWTDGKSLFVDTVMDAGVADDVARSTITAYNAFLEQATGLNTKERKKRAKKSVEGADSE